MLERRVAAPEVVDLERVEVRRRSLGLVLLEAARAVCPDVRLQLGPSLGDFQTVEGAGAAGWVDPLAARMRALVAEDRPIRREVVGLDPACERFTAQADPDVVSLLRLWQDAVVPMATCGDLVVLAPGPFAPSTGAVGPFTLTAVGDGLVLGLGCGVQPVLAPQPASRWLDVLGVRTLGAFNAACISGHVAELIRVAEGLHEKRIGQIADALVARDPRVICIAGPSGAGKSTFIKRLMVQLQIDGIHPRAISLDDYYLDREATPLGPDGTYDFEALEALDLPRLRGDLAALLAGQAVLTSRYEFATGRSSPDGGPLLRLGPTDVLILEGIHGLNPALLATVPASAGVARVFVWPGTTLSIDRLSHVGLGDMRLLRRLVRDRRARGTAAATNIMRWAAVRAGEARHILPYMPEADEIFDASLVYEPAVLKVYAERYLLEVPEDHPAFPTALRLRQLLSRFVAIYPDHVPPTSLLREFIGGSGFEY